MKLIQNNWVLLCLFITLLLILLGFRFWTPIVGGEILDRVDKVTEVQELLNRMSPEEKNSHFFMTLFLDTLFPLVYGVFFLGTTSRVFQNIGNRLCIPTLALVPIDLSENFIQLLALKKHEELLPIKEILTPLKFILFDASLVISVISISYILCKRRTSKSA